MSQSMSHASHFLFSCLFFLGGFVPLVAAKHFIMLKKRLNLWKSAKATVYHITYQTIGGGDRIGFYPKYRYTYAGREYSGTPSIGVRLNKYKTGDVIEIRINPSSPAESDILDHFTIGPVSLLTLDACILVFSAMGFLCLAVGTVSFVLFLFKDGHAAGMVK
jgi:hypothetical protein